MSNAKKATKEYPKLSPKDFVIIGLDTDHKEGDHPLWDERAFLEPDEHMVRNVLALGVIEPVVVQKCPKLGLIVNDGRSRVLRARKANELIEKQGGTDFISVPYVVREDDEKTQISIMVSTNECRQEDGILVKAAKAKRMKNWGCSIDRIAESFGTTRATIYNWFKLESASNDVKEAVSKGQITVEAAKTLSVLPKEDQKKTLDEVLRKQAERQARQALPPLVLDKPSPSDKAPEEKSQEEKPANDDQPQESKPAVTFPAPETQETKPVRKSSVSQQVRTAVKGIDYDAAPTIKEIRTILKAFDEAKPGAPIIELSDDEQLLMRILTGQWPLSKSPRLKNLIGLVRDEKI